MNNVAYSQFAATNDILDSLNRIHDAKLTGTLGNNEFSQTILKTWNLFVGKIKQGKVSSDEIESMESLLPGPNGDKCFNIKHKGLNDIDSIAKKSVYKALAEKDNELINSNENSEEVSFRRSI